MRRILLSLSFAGTLALLGCEGDPLVPGNGSITLRLVPPAAPAPSAAVVAEAAEPQAAEPEAAPQLAQVPLESVRVTVSGPTSKSTTFACSPSLCEGTVTGLEEGTYSVRVEGLVNGEVDHFGETGGVRVEADQNTAATVTFASFVPVLDPFPAETVDVPRFTVSYSAVPSAETYLVEWATRSDFSNASSRSVTGTSTEVLVDEDAEYFVRVRAVNDAVGENGRASDVLSLATFHAVAAVTVSPASPTIAAGTTQQFTAEARDVDDIVMDPVTFHWTSSDHSVATVDPETGLVTGVGEGSATITAEAKGTAGHAALTVTVTAVELAFLVEPSNVQEGAPINPALQIVILDDQGLRVRSASDPVTLQIGTNPSGGALWGATTVNAVDGVATFSGVTVDWAGAGYTLHASSGGLKEAVSAAFDVTPGAGPSGAAVLANTDYVDYFVDGGSSSEASNVVATLGFVGQAAETFTSITHASIAAVTRDNAILAIPELEEGDLIPDLSSAARQRIVDFVEKRGGTLLIFLDPFNSLINTLFGHSVAFGTGPAPYNLLAAASNTPFATGPLSVPALSATIGLDPATLPAGSLSMYGVATTSVVVVIPQGAGQIIYMGWDWFNAAPIGTGDGGWVEVLRRAALF